jgi:hypothetical protein
MPMLFRDFFERPIHLQAFAGPWIRLELKDFRSGFAPLTPIVTAV